MAIPVLHSSDSGVGKSCVLMQFLEGKFKYDSETTIGVEFGSKTVDIGEQKIKMQIWDTVLSCCIVVRLDRRLSSPSQGHTIAALSLQFSCMTSPTAPPSII